MGAACAGCTRKTAIGISMRGQEIEKKSKRTKTHSTQQYHYGASMPVSILSFALESTFPFLAASNLTKPSRDINLVGPNNRRCLAQEAVYKEKLHRAAAGGGRQKANQHIEESMLTV